MDFVQGLNLCENQYELVQVFSLYSIKESAISWLKLVYHKIRLFNDKPLQRSGRFNGQDSQGCGHSFYKSKPQ